MRKKKYFCSALLVMLMSVCLFACGKEPLIELYVVGAGEGSVYEVSPGETLQFKAEVENLNEEDIEYLVVSGAGVISETGLLTASIDAEVGSTIKVQAKVGNVKSNEISVTVDDLEPSAITLSGKDGKTKLAKGGTVEFEMTYTPTYATLRDYTLSVTQGAEYVNTTKLAEEGILEIKDDVEFSDITNKNIIVTATLNANSSITTSMTIEVVDESTVASVEALHKTINVVTATGRETISAQAYNAAGDPIDVSGFSYISSNESIATIDQSTGRVIPRGHGKTTITVRTANNTETTCDLYIIVPPTGLTINGLSDTINKNEKMSYSLRDALKFNVSLTREGLTCTKSLKYDFTLLDADGVPVDVPSSSVATVDENNNITFLQQGQVLVTVSSNSSLNGVKVPSAHERSTQITIDVNNGYNVDSVSDLINYANVANAGTVCNITKDIYLTSDENFGKNDNGKYSTLNFYGDRTIFGNGYVISTHRLPLISDDETSKETGGNCLLEFYSSNQNANVPFTVEIQDLEIIGCSGVNGKYSGELAEYMGKSTVNYKANGDYNLYNSYRIGLIIHGNSYNDIINYSQGKAYAKDLYISNVKVSGFDVAMRLAHVVNGLVTNCEISNCYSNGIESNQNIIEFNNLKLGQVGAFGIEIVPDDMKDKQSDNPKGTAGANYDQTPIVKMTGNIDSNSYNNGVYTDYMKNSAFSQIPEIINATISGLTEAIYNEVQSLVSNEEQFKNDLSGVADESIYTTIKDASNQDIKVLNFYLLIFVDPTKYIGYSQGGNMENKFTNYESDSNNGNMINLKDMLVAKGAALASGQEYTDYKNYKYIQMDLENIPLKLLDPRLDGVVNLGQVVMINQAYEGI